jgi:hypothetical protein
MDEVIKSELYFEGDLIIHKQTQPTENLILERNQDLRKNEGAIRDLKDADGETWGRMVASIPLIMFEQAIKAGYKLRSKEKGEASKELFRFLQSPLGKTCLIRDKL